MRVNENGVDRDMTPKEIKQWKTDVAAMLERTILQQIQDLEASITPRMRDEAILGDNEKLKATRAKIDKLRKKL